MAFNWEAQIQRANGEYVVTDFQQAAYQLVTEQVLYESNPAQRTSFRVVKAYEQSYREFAMLMGLLLDVSPGNRYAAVVPVATRTTALSKLETLFLLSLRQVFHNRMMAGWGFGAESQISHLSYAARGIDRLPQIHEGAASRHMFAQGEAPATNADWHHIDGGHTRAEANAIIREINTLKQEAEHEQANPADGLGSGDEGDGGERQYRRRDDREGGRANGRDAGPPAPPWAAVGADGSDDEGNDDEGISAPAAAPPFLAAPASAPVPPFAGDHRRLSAWGRVRRVYRELVMLRDTLRARLLGDREAQRSAPPTTAQMGPSARDGGRQRERD